MKPRVTPTQISEMAATGTANFAMPPKAWKCSIDVLIMMPLVNRLDRCIVVPKTNPLAADRAYPLKVLAEYSW